MAAAATRARRLAKHARLVDTQLRPREAASLIDLVEHFLAKRAAHLAALAAIDGELGRVYARLSADLPAAVPDAPASSQAAPEPAPVVIIQRPPLPPLTTGTSIAAAADAIVSALEKEHGQVSNEWIRQACEGFSHQTIKRALSRLVESGRVLRTGRTHGTRYQLQPLKAAPKGSSSKPTARPAAAAPTQSPEPEAHGPTPPSRVVVADGIEYEPAWSPHRNAPSLIGDRPTRNA